MNIAIIPARGGSKRIPRKNIKDFCGQPMLAYPIKAALESGVVDKVVVSTDDHEIADIARQYGAEVPFMREPQLADDYTDHSCDPQYLTPTAADGVEYRKLCLPVCHHAAVKCQLH
ncbi:8-amino-3,8-dideoxy-manno-octulosonate cytidylyltransferase [Alishewanella longhuensis]